MLLSQCIIFFMKRLTDAINNKPIGSIIKYIDTYSYKNFSVPGIILSVVNLSDASQLTVKTDGGGNGTVYTDRSFADNSSCRVFYF